MFTPRKKGRLSIAALGAALGRLLACAACVLACGRGAFAEDGIPSSVRGKIRLEKPAESIRLVLENPRLRNAEVAAADVSAGGAYEFQGLTERTYRLVAWIDGKRQDRRELTVVCTAGSAMTKDFFYGKNDSTLMIYFPAEDPDVVDVAELRKEYPKEIRREYEKALDDYAGGNLLRAVERLRAVAELQPDFYGAHSRLGTLYQQNGCYDDAQREYTLASALSPRSAQPLLNLASVQIQAASSRGDPASLDLAIENTKKALALKPLSALAHCLAGAAYVKAASFDDAEKSFLRALDINARMAAARLLLSDLYMRQENWEGAVEHLKAYLDDNPVAPDRGFVKELRAEAERNLKSNPAR